MAVEVTVKDLETGESDSCVVRDGDYLVVTTDPAYVDGVQVHKGGQTHVVTVKGRTAG